MEKVSSGKGGGLKRYRTRPEPQKKKIEPKKKVVKKTSPKKINLKPIPWLVPEAIEAMEKHIKEYGDQLIKVLEFGSGGSSLWFLNFKNVLLTSIEHQNKYGQALMEEVQDLERRDRFLLFVNTRPYDDIPFNKSISAKFGDEKFDLILIDGRDRVKCAEAAKKLIAPEGMVILDNSERKRYDPILEMFKDWPIAWAKKGWKTTWWYCPCEEDTA